MRERRDGVLLVPMKPLLLWSACLSVVLGLASCHSMVRRAVDLSAYKTFQVQPQSGDSLGMAGILADRMTAVGIDCKAGGQTKADALVRYSTEALPGRADRIQKLVIEIVDARTGKRVTSSRSDQEASLMPESNVSMADLAIRSLLAATPGPSGRPRGSLMERETLF